MYSKVALVAGLAAAIVGDASAFTSSMTRGAISTRATSSISRVAPRRALVAPLRMSEDGAGKEAKGDEASAASGEMIVTDEGDYFGVDAQGNKVKLSLATLEKKYLDACNAYYNDKKPTLSDAEFDQLREDLEFSGSDVAVMNRMEVMFMVAANRYAEGKPIMSDEEFDDIRRKLKARNSAAVIHKVPTCRVDTNTCKSDLTTDGAKNAVLYLPIVAVVSIIVAELNFLVNGDGGGPVISLITISPIIAIVSYVLKNFVIFQSPYIVKATCPSCYTEQNIFFGDIMFCNGKAENKVNTLCVNGACGCNLRANRERMIVETDYGPSGAPAAPAVVK